VCTSKCSKVLWTKSLILADKGIKDGVSCDDCIKSLVHFNIFFHKMNSVWEWPVWWDKKVTEEGGLAKQPRGKIMYNETACGGLLVSFALFLFLTCSPRRTAFHFIQNKRVWLELFPNGAPILNPRSSMSASQEEIAIAMEKRSGFFFYICSMHSRTQTRLLYLWLPYFLHPTMKLISIKWINWGEGSLHESWQFQAYEYCILPWQNSRNKC
jgi:hypothetical protein